ncbi:MAG TPA: hypothetical protein PKY22_06320 [Accumulibacter sp.]|nr:hypothetical protein [Accumulibacter sp.]
MLADGGGAMKVSSTMTDTPAAGYLFKQARHCGCLDGGSSVSGDPEFDKAAGLSNSSSRASSSATDRSSDIWYNYTDREGYEGIMRDRAIKGNSLRLVFATNMALNPQQAENTLFIGAASHFGRGDYVVQFVADLGVKFVPFEPGEWVTVGTLRFNRHIDVLYAGPNKN